MSLLGACVHDVGVATIQLAPLPGAAPRGTTAALTTRYRFASKILLSELFPAVLPQAKVALPRVKIPPAVVVKFILAACRSW